MVVLNRVWVGISNPKDILFFAAFFQQFVQVIPLFEYQPGDSNFKLDSFGLCQFIDCLFKF